MALQELAVDARKNSDKTFAETQRDFSAWLLEVQERPTFYSLQYIPGEVAENDGTTHKNGWFADQDGNRLNVLRNTGVYQKEAAALSWFAAWCKDGKEESAVLICPPTEDPGIYPVGRITYVEKVEREGVIWLQKCSMVAKFTRGGCVTFAKSISESNGGHPDISDDPEVLRSTPIAFDLPQGVSWVPFFKRLVATLPSLDLIESGEAYTLAKKAARDGELITRMFYPFIKNLKTRLEAVVVGASIELLARRMGYHSIGIKIDCPGVTNTQAFREEMMGAYNTLHNASYYDYSPRDYLFDKKGVCVSCGEERSDLGPCKMCEFCDRSGAYKGGSQSL